MQLSTTEFFHLTLNTICAILGIVLSLYLSAKVVMSKQDKRWLKLSLLSGLLVTSITLLILLIVSLTVLKTNWAMVVLVPAILLGLSIFFCISYFVADWWISSKINKKTQRWKSMRFLFVK